MKNLYELRGEGESVRGIAQRLGVSRNTVRKYLRGEEVPKQKPRPPRGSKVEAHRDYLQKQLSAGVDNCVVLLRELRKKGYSGSYTILKQFVHPLRQPRQPKATVRFETEPGEQAQVDFGLFRYLTPVGATRQVYCFVLVLSWSRALYVEFVARADLATFLRCHWNAFGFLGGIPRRCLYDNAKVVVLGRNEQGEVSYQPEFLDFSLRLGFRVQLCKPYRAQTKGRVENGVKYVRANFWPTARFVDLADLNRQGREWLDGVANVRLHGTTNERPLDRLAVERDDLLALPGLERVQAYLREGRKVGRDGFVQWQRGVYGVPWQWAGKTVQVQGGDNVVEIWANGERIALHSRATKPGQRFPVPGQWQGLSSEGQRPPKEALGVQVLTVQVEARPLEVYDSYATGERR